MSISERERQALDSIEGEFAHSAPRLASMLVMFSRLSADEQMPAREPVRSVTGEAGGVASPDGRASRRRVRRRHIGRKARGWVWIAVVAALLALAMTLTHGNRVSACAHSLTSCERLPTGFPAGLGESGR